MNEYQAFNRTESLRRGIDPAVTEAAWNTEGGLTETVKVGMFDTGWSFWPPQSNVSPCIPVHNIVDGVDRNPKSCSKRVASLAGCMSSPDFQYCSIVQLGKPIAFAPGEIPAPMHTVTDAARMPALSNHVRVVVLKSPQEEMVRPNAGAIVTPMANVQAFGDLSEMQTPRDAMHPIADELTISPADLNVAVASGLADALGLPALIRLDDSAPEPSFEVLLREPPCGIMNVHREASFPGVSPPDGCTSRGLCVKELYHA